MIKIKLIGGLGNQLFQIAYAQKLSQIYDEPIVLDKNSYETYKIRNYALDHFYISNNIKIENKNSSIPHNFYRVFQKILKILTNSDYVGELIFKFLSKRGYYFNFDRYFYKHLVSKKQKKYVYGYFQSEKYFKGINLSLLEVKTQPTNKELKLIHDLEKTNSVAVSMRLGKDYQNNKNLNVCNEEFYIKAIKKINNLVEDPTFYVFSDEIEYAKKINLPFNVVYVEGFNEYESLRLMYSCKHFVISNSSFSWWGAYLSKNSSKIIISPNKWYNNSSGEPDIFYDQMTRLN